MSDTCDGKTTKASPDPFPGAGVFSPRQVRFLVAYRSAGTIASAARGSGIHRATAHRWQASIPGFAAAMAAAWEEGRQARLARVRQAEAERSAWRAERERQRLPMRKRLLAAARAVKAARRRAGR